MTKTEIGWTHPTAITGRRLFVLNTIVRNKKSERRAAARPRQCKPIGSKLYLSSSLTCSSWVGCCCCCCCSTPLLSLVPFALAVVCSFGCCSSDMIKGCWLVLVDAIEFDDVPSSKTCGSYRREIVGVNENKIQYRRATGRRTRTGSENVSRQGVRRRRWLGKMAAADGRAT